MRVIVVGCEYTGVTTLIEGLNADARVYMGDFEDATAPTWSNMVDGQINVRDRWHDQLNYVDPETGDLTTAPTSATGAGDLTDLQIPTTYMGEADGAQLTSVGVSKEGLVSAIYADGSTVYLGQVAMASFNSLEGLRQQGDAHWTSTVESGNPIFGTANEGMFGSVNSGSLERSNVDITDELVQLIAAQRNFQANSKAIEAANTLTTTIVNIRT